MASEEQIQCMKLSDVLGRVTDANTGTAIESERYAEGLANKLYDHGLLCSKNIRGCYFFYLASALPTRPGRTLRVASNERPFLPT